MGQEDFFSRQLDQAGKVLSRVIARLLSLRSDGQINKALEISNESLNEIDIDLHELIDTPTEQIIQNLEEKNLNKNHLNSLADIFLEIADMHIGTDINDKYRSLYEKAVRIYEYLNSTETTYSIDRYNKIERIRKLL